MRNRFHVCTALVLCSSVAFAQDASIPSLSPGGVNLGNTGAAPLTTPSLLTPPASTETSSGFDVPLLSGTTPASSTEQKPGTASEKEGGFSLPGGSGYAPLDFTPGQGRFDRAPLSFSTTIQQGYDDNIYSSSGKPGTQPVKGSAITYLTQGVDLLLSQSRLGLSLEATGGGQYYWDRSGDQLLPNGGLSLLFAYKLTPRAQFSAVINGSYTAQPSLSVINGLSQSSNGNGYLSANGKFDLLYQWTPRVSTDTTYMAVGNVYSGSQQSVNNYLEQTIGEALRYAFSSRWTGVFEGRASQNTHDNNSQIDSKTYFLLAGCDVTVSRRLASSFRAGLTTQDYDAEGVGSSSSPYAEASLDYAVAKNSSLSLSGRYGFDNGGNTGLQSTKSTRVGLGFTQTFSPKLRGTASVNYNHSGVGGLSTDTQDAISASLGAQYTISHNLTLFANATRFQVFSTESIYENARDTYNLGLTYQY